MSTWSERKRRKDRKVAIGCVLFALALTTLDRPGGAIYALDLLAVLTLVAWVVGRRGREVPHS